MKTKYSAHVTLPDGRQHTRQTDRPYTHAVVENRMDGKGWSVIAFCSSHHLAVKKANTQTYNNLRNYLRDPEHYTNAVTRVVDVTLEEN